MATVIDALVVTLGLDSSKFKKGSKDVTEEMRKQRKEAEQMAKDMEASGKRAASFFGSIRNEVIALAGVSLSLYGIKNFVTEMTQSLTKLSVSAKALDLTPKQLEGWTGASEAVGSSAERITGVIGNLQKLVNDFRGGGDISNNPLVKVLGGIEGVVGKKFDLRTMSGSDILQAVMENWHKFSKDAQRKVGADLGLDDAQIQGFAEKGPNSFAELKRRFEDQSKATKSLVDDARRLNVEFVSLRRNFEAAGQTLFKAMLPYIEKIPPLLTSLSNWVTKNGPSIEQFFSDASSAIGDAVSMVGGWQNALEILLVFMAGKWSLGMLASVVKVTKGFGPLIAAIAAVSAWDKVGEAQAEAKKQGIDVGEYLVDKLNKNDSSKDSLKNRFFRWWDGVSAGDNTYTAYGSMPRGIRNNNPGNLNFANQSGAVMEGGAGGRFAVFETMQHGVAALYKQLQIYFKRGVNTLSSIVNTYAPASDGNDVGSYISALSRATGKGVNEVIDANDTHTIARLMQGIADHENGKGYISSSDIMGGIQLGSRSTAMSRPNGQSPNKTDIHIGEMTVQSNASSIKSLGEDVNNATRRNGLVMAYSTGQ